MGIHRSERLASVMQAELSNLILKEVDVPPGVLVTISSIEVASDSKSAKIGISVFPEAKTKEMMKLLKESAGGLHYRLIRVMNIRTVPTLEFFADLGNKNAAAVERVFIEPLPAPDKKVAKRKISG